MKEALIDISVLLVFFTRYEQFKKVFEQVKKARPNELFLYQDGPRKERIDDIENISKCRAIAEEIDWNCKVHRWYRKENHGCDPSGYLAHTWAFSHTEKCIVIEDDDVPSSSFFRFCKELLDRYENDKRVMLISALNVDEITEYCPYSYFFSGTTFTAGCWASWSRVIKQWDSNYTFLDNEYNLNLFHQKILHEKFSKGFLPQCINHKHTNIEHFETIMISNQYLNNGLTIVPQKNMVKNIGLTDDATHTMLSLEDMPKATRKIFEMMTYNINGDILHPPYICEDYEYKKRAYRLYAWGHPIVKIKRLIETTLRLIKHGKITLAIKNLYQKLENIKNKSVS